MNFRNSLKNRPLVMDGSMGALLQKRGLPAGMAPDVWMLHNRAVIEGVHREYVEAGADIVLSNTFGASKWRLEEYDAYADIKKINAVAVELARKGACDKAFVAGDIGPSGETIFPTGQKPFDEVCDIFYEQAKILIELGVDVIAIETMFDSLEYRCALSAVRAASLNIPVIAFATFNTDGITDTGASPENIVAIAEGFHVDAVGINCSTGPDSMVPVVQKMRKLSNLPVAVQPNAGLPEMRNGETVFPLSATQMAPYVEQFLDSGARIIGGCCGTVPEFIKLTKKIVASWSEQKSEKPAERKIRTLISSQSGFIQLGGNEPFVGIGEKMNPSGRKRLSDALKAGDMSKLMEDAKLQINAGGKLLDLNVGVPLVDEPELMKEAVVMFQNQYPHVPLMLDSSNSFALNKGAGVYYGRPLLNSINAEEEKIEEMLPIIRRHGAAVICLLTGVEVPESAEERFKNGVRTFEILQQTCGLKEEDVVFDCLGLVISAMQEGSKQTLRTIDMIKDRFPASGTTLGLSNTSFGLPNRRFVHDAFMVMAIQRGLDSAIMSVTDNIGRIMSDAASMWGPKANSVQHFIAEHAEPLKLGLGPKDKETKSVKKEGSSEPEWVFKLTGQEQSIFRGVVNGDKESVAKDINEFVKTQSDDSMKLFMDVMTPAIRHLGDLFAARVKFIPHLIAAADAMKAGVAILEPHLIKARAASNEEKGCVIFATVKGDIHDIGKNICVLMLRNFGYDVVDLGRNVDPEVIIKAGLEHKAKVLALSALMTTTMIQMKVVVDAVKERKLPFKVVIGGAVVTPEFAREIQADGFSTDVGTAVNEMERVIALLDALEVT